MSEITGARHFVDGSDDPNIPALGPFLDGNDNLYVVAESSALGNTLGIFKSTNDGSTWAEVDTGNRPSILNGLSTWSVTQVGTVLHIATLSNGFADGMDVRWRIRYHTFNTSDASSNDDTWQITNEDVVDPTGASKASFAMVDIAIRSDGDVIIVHQGSDAAVMGSDFDRIAYSRKEGTTWTTDIAVHSTSDERNQLSVNCVFGTGDNLHIFWWESALGVNEAYAKTLDSGNSLSTRIEWHDDTWGFFHRPKPISYDRAGTQYVLAVIPDQTSFDYFSRELEEDGSDDISTNLSTQTLSSDNTTTPNIGLVLDLESGDAWAAYRRVTNLDLHTKEKAGSGAWGSDTQRQTGDHRGSWWQAYARDGGNHLGYVYCDHDGSPIQKLYFDEITTGAGGQTVAVGTLAETDFLRPIPQFGTSVTILAETNSLLPVVAFQPNHIPDFTGATGAFQGHQNPVHQIGSNLFIIERLNSTDIGVYKSTDNGAAWSQVATLTGIPPGAQTFHTLATIVDSDDIHVITSAAGGEIQYHIFDPGTDTFTLSREEVSPDIVTGSGNRVVGVVVRSDGSVVCLYRTTSTPFVIKYAIRNGSWTNDLAISADDDVDSLHTAAIVLGASDRVHFFWHNHTDGTIYHRTLNSADVLQTEQLVTSPGTGPVDIDNYSAGRYAKSGGVRIGYFYETSALKLSVIHADSADAPSWTQDSDITDEQIPDGQSQHRLLAGLVGDDTNEQFLLCFQRSDLSVFFSIRPDGGSWGADTDTGLDALNDGNDDLSSGNFGIRVSGGIVFLNWWSIASQTPPDDWLYQEVGLGQEVAIGPLAATDSLIPIGVSIYKTIGTLVEVNTLLTVNLTQAGGQDIQVGTMVEVGSLLDIPGTKIVAIGTLTELEGLQSIIGVHVVNIGTLLQADILIPVGLDILLTMDLFIAIDLTDALTLAQAQAALGLGTPKSGDHVAKIYHPARRIVRR